MNSPLCHIVSFRLFVILNSDDQKDKTTHAPEVKTTGESLDLNKLLTKKSSSSSSSSSSNNGRSDQGTSEYYLFVLVVVDVKVTSVIATSPVYFY